MFGKIKGKFGHPNYIERLPYVAVRKSGSMDCRLFRQLIEDTTFDLYPKETVALAIKVNDHGRLLTGPVMWTMDTGQGRMANLEDEGWDKWAEEIQNKGVIWSQTPSRPPSARLRLLERYQKSSRGEKED